MLLSTGIRPTPSTHFRGVVEHQVAGGTAQRAYVSQPPPTRQIQQLEELPGVSYRPLAKSDNLSFDLCMIFRRDDESPLLRAFIDVVRGIAATQRRRKARRLNPAQVVPAARSARR
ncbi:MAG: hypothetical protein IPM80_24105 [Proteobacteria bacterium]|nr:hypothetical protein [Pseudomonadota bacterium]